MKPRAASGLPVQSAGLPHHPFYREISDILLAVNRAYGKSDYIPCICWGHNARLCSRMSAAQYPITEGRLQSRIYEKHTPDGAIVPHVAYEVSLSRLWQCRRTGRLIKRA